MGAVHRLQFRARLVRLQRPHHLGQLAGSRNEMDRTGGRRRAHHPYRQASDQVGGRSLLQPRATCSSRPLGVEYGAGAHLLTSMSRQRRNRRLRLKIAFLRFSTVHCVEPEGRLRVESALPALASREEGRADILDVIQTVQGVQWSALTSRPKKDRTSPRRSDIQLK
jgi:hypothetical protein